MVGVSALVGALDLHELEKPRAGDVAAIRHPGAAAKSASSSSRTLASETGGVGSGGSRASRYGSNSSSAVPPLLGHRT